MKLKKIYIQLERMTGWLAEFFLIQLKAVPTAKL